jgi:hypothetical protein
MKCIPLRVAAAGVMTIAFGACAASKSPSPIEVCTPPFTPGPQILYPENHPRGVPVDVGELLYSEGAGLGAQGTLYLQGDGIITVAPQGIAPTPYPSPIATPGLLGGPIAYVTFGKLKPATTYVVKYKAPASQGTPQVCAPVVAFTQTSFTTK